MRFGPVVQRINPAFTNCVWTLGTLHKVLRKWIQQHVLKIVPAHHEFHVHISSCLFYTCKKKFSLIYLFDTVLREITVFFFPTANTLK